MSVRNLASTSFGKPLAHPCQPTDSRRWRSGSEIAVSAEDSLASAAAAAHSLTPAKHVRGGKLGEEGAVFRHGLPIYLDTYIPRHLAPIGTLRELPSGSRSLAHASRQIAGGGGRGRRSPSPPWTPSRRLLPLLTHCIGVSRYVKCMFVIPE
jgi:hypothetical protein